MDKSIPDGISHGKMINSKMIKIINGRELIKKPLRLVTIVMVEVFSVARSPVARSENHQCLSTGGSDLDIITKLLNTDWFHWESWLTN